MTSHLVCLVSERNFNIFVSSFIQRTFESNENKFESAFIRIFLWDYFLYQQQSNLLASDANFVRPYLSLFGCIDLTLAFVGQ